MPEMRAIVQRNLVRVAIVVAAIAIGWIAVEYLVPSSSSTNAGGPSGAMGQLAPVFDLRDDDGHASSLDRYRGSIVVMNLWASWCPPCRAEMPDLQRLTEAYGRRGVAVIGVNEGESPQRAREFAGALGIRFPIWIDASQRYGRVYSALGLPTTVIIDRRGVVRHGFDGPLTFDEMRAAVTPMLDAPS
jgi:peroxiredoxin